MKKLTHLFYVPFTGLGLYNGYRGDTWLKNRIAIFKQFVVPSLRAQTDEDFVIWISWRREEKYNPIVQEFKRYMEESFVDETKVVFTYAGVCFYDDKYPDVIAQDRLISALHGSMPALFDYVGESDYVLMTIQPSDDLYTTRAVEGIKKIFEAHPDVSGMGFKYGYICNYNTKEVSEYNPETNPPFYTFKFPKADFTDPLRHAQFTALKRDSGQYKAGTPCPSHEYVPECVKFAVVDDVRGFMVGTHGNNISTTFTNPYKGEAVGSSVFEDFGIHKVEPLKQNIDMFQKIYILLPYRAQRKIRYILHEWKLLKISTWPGLIK